MFRRPTRLYNLEKSSARTRERLLEARRMNATIPERLRWWNAKVRRLQMEGTANSGRWHEAAKIATSLLADMEKSQMFTAPERLQVVTCIAVLEDDAANVNDKRQAAKQIGDMFGVFDSKREESNLRQQEKQDVEKGEMKEARAAADAGAELAGAPTLSLLEKLKGADGAANVS